jgi:hypothetical protein
MSLDVTLYRHYHITYDAGVTLVEKEEELYSANITHNLGKMAIKAEVYEALWRPHLLHPSCTKEMKEDFNSDDRDRWQREYDFEDSVKMYAKDIIPFLEKGLKKLKAKPEYYEKFNSPNGWGMYEHFVPFVEKYLQACKEFPESRISVSR